MRGLAAARAYQQSSGHRNLRDQEADIFHRANAGLRAVGGGDGMSATRALADNGRLWTTLMDLMRDPTNPLAPALKAMIISVGMAVQRELSKDAPDFGFLIGVNENLAAGLSGR